MTPARSATPPNYLVLGHLSRDFPSQAPVQANPSLPATLGGTAAFAALTARALGREPAVVTSGSDDLDLTPLAGIPVHRIPSAESTTFTNEYAGDQRRQRLGSRAGAIDPSSVPGEWLGADIIHLAPIAAEFPPSAAARFAGEPFLGVTPQGWMRRWDATGHVHPASWEPAREALAVADAVVSSLEDLGGDEALVEGMVAACRLLVLTEGSGGARVYWNGDVRRIPAPRVELVDPTGAGDIFAAAFFIRLQQTRDPWEAARFANILAATSVTRHGLDSIPTPDEVQRADMVWVR